MLLLEELKREYDELLNQLGDPELISDWEKFEKLNARKKTLENIIEKEKEIKDLENRIEENKAIMSAGEDKELSSLAEAETSELQERKKLLEKEINDLFSEAKRASFTRVQAKGGEERTFFDSSSATRVPQSGTKGGEERTFFDSSRKAGLGKKIIIKKSGEQAVIVEIRAGTGGEEAGLFAEDLFHMYSKYGQSSGWKQKVLDSHPTGIGGFKEIVFELSDGDVFSKMKYEAGVHRVQRIPATEKNGRIHTSTASVAILPKPNKTEMKIKPDELRIDFFRSSGPGGQNVNKRETAVRITHLPSGIVVASQTERNQLQNKENALSILTAKIMARKEEEELNKVGGARREQIGQAKRVEKIRTYNFPQNRVTDHRIKKSFHDIESIMAGKLEPILKQLNQN
ncbi:MAG: PCRF domain-containing protein [bacterium]|nr:PCRF domain-containing protein [bacterium]